MNLAIDELRARGTPNRAAVHAFLSRGSFPLAEGSRVTFVYRGAADAVRLRHWIFGLPSSMDLARLEGTELWYLVVELPAGSRVEYKFEIVAGGERTLVMDPLNPLVAHDPMGSNSVCQASGYETPEWAMADDEARPGELEDLSVPDDRGGQRVTVYVPARYRRHRRYPLLVVHDGDDYLRFAALQTVLDNLIHRLEIPPMIVALTRPRERLLDYADDPAHARFLAERLLPTLEQRYTLMADPSGRGLMGASFGAVASLAASWRYPGRFGRLLLQSGSFAFTDIGEQRRGPAFDPVVKFVNAFRADPGTPAEKIFMSCGMYESLIYENRSMLPLLQSTGMNVRYTESRDGHNWENWRDRLREGLSWLFPGPLWLVYE
jgi:enterochelin esterase family protein